MGTTNIKLYELLRWDMKLPEAKAREFVETIDEVISERMMEQKAEYKSLWKEDFSTLHTRFSSLDKKLDTEVNRLELKIAETKNDLIKAIYRVGLIQFLAIVSSVVGITSFMLRK